MPEIIPNHRIDIAKIERRILVGYLLRSRPLLERLDDGIECYSCCADIDDAVRVDSERNKFSWFGSNGRYPSIVASWFIVITFCTRITNS